MNEGKGQGRAKVEQREREIYSLQIKAYDAEIALLEEKAKLDKYRLRCARDEEAGAIVNWQLIFSR